jgi:hypothetical protein
LPEEPALVESRLGDGKVILAAFPAHTAWTSLPTQKVFVPLILQMVAYLQRRPDLSLSPTVAADGVVEITAASTWGTVGAKVFPPAGGVLSVPELQRLGNRLVGSFSETSQAGHYLVEVPNLKTGQATTLGFAVNLAPDESDFQVLSLQDARTLLPWADLHYVAAAKLDLAKGQGPELWQFLIWIVFAVIGIEFLLATTSGKRLEGDEAPTVGRRIRDLSPGAWVGRMTGAGEKTGP